MEITLLPHVNGSASVEDIKKAAQITARICYSEKDIDSLVEEPFNSELVDGRLIKSGHHSPFEHKHLTFYMKGLPKIMAMILNNERQYVTSEKSARYTQMKDLIPEQKELYDKWINKLMPVIDAIYPEISKTEDRSGAIKKLAQENARYMTSVFTPTKMAYTINARQINFFISEFGKYVEKNKDSKSVFERTLASNMEEFLKQVQNYKVEGLQNQTDRHLSIFKENPVDEYFGDVYSTNYLLSFAGLAQAHRHRTIRYSMQTPGLNAKHGFFVPGIIKGTKMHNEWLSDLLKIAENDFPQAQLIGVSERGNIEDFRSKCILRLCGHAQYEIMQNTKQTAQKYALCKSEVNDWISPKCTQRSLKCSGNCIWGGKRALERIV